MSIERGFRPESQKEISEVSVIAELREKGIKESEMYRQWRDQEEARVTSEEGNLDLLQREARMLKQAGLDEEALRHMRDARDAAEEMYQDDVVDRINEEIRGWVGK
jgi:hypothetical protein